MFRKCFQLLDLRDVTLPVDRNGKTRQAKKLAMSIAVLIHVARRFTKQASQVVYFLDQTLLESSYFYFNVSAI